jgi:hypothetical protein
LIARIGKYDFFLTVQQAVTLGDIAHVGCGANERVSRDKARNNT